MTGSLPMSLRIYRTLSAAAVPLAPLLIKRRLRQGKEDSARIDERRARSLVRARRKDVGAAGADELIAEGVERA